MARISEASLLSMLPRAPYIPDARSKDRAKVVYLSSVGCHCAARAVREWRSVLWTKHDEPGKLRVRRLPNTGNILRTIATPEKTGKLWTKVLLMYTLVSLGSRQEDDAQCEATKQSTTGFHIDTERRYK